jgi:hypothetical protein
MAAVTKNRNFFKWPKLLYFKPECASTDTIWKGAIQESFQQSLVDIGTVVYEEKIFFKFHPPFFLICIIGQNRQKFIVHKKEKRGDEILIVHCCFSVSQNELKF